MLLHSQYKMVCVRNENKEVGKLNEIYMYCCTCIWRDIVEE